MAPFKKLNVIKINQKVLEGRIAQVEARQEKEREDQERRELEMAISLSKGMNENIADSSSRLFRAEHAGVSRMSVAQYQPNSDLSTWKYSELRDTINTSCDTKLLDACRQEFQRRLKAYHAWKTSRNTRPNAEIGATVIQGTSNTYAPSAPSLPSMLDSPGTRHRYFRIPLMRPDGSEDTEGRSWWFAHYDGQFVVRQIELHQDKMPVLLQAGQEGSCTQMCKLSLEATGLTRRPGAEIHWYEFERLWTQYGGPPPYSPW